ncbi:hypothetical protein HY620_03255 [Candidatus Uhrbacteria bacterium]|nr:hypothetical protein [Candidatus Uhrbacteria bacterium]
MVEDYTSRISEKELEKSYWFVTHIQRLRKEAHIVFAVIVGCIYAVLFWQLISLYVIERGSTQQLVGTAKGSLAKLLQHKGAQDLSLTRAGVVPSSRESYDFYASVTNSNTDWRAYFDVVFLVDGKALDPVQAFIYPGETKYVLKLGIANPQSSAVQARIENVRWHKMTKAAGRFLDERNRLAAQDITLVSENAPSSTKRVSKIQCIVHNASAFHFWEANIPIVVLSGNAVIALKMLPITNLTSGEKRNVAAFWNEELDTSGVLSYDVHPEADIFEPTAFKRSR